ncbi:MAG: hypothetical protein K8I02_02880, partial [Candidatus Methylomirabilis sp.]|nr:hypothetical protein [Deltaproteobacteria bacterium]
LRDPAAGAIPRRVRERELAFVRSDPKLHWTGEKAAGDGWREVGPFDVGGRTRALALDVRSSSVLLAGAVSGGVWKSVDGGVSWTRKSPAEAHKSVTSLAQDPRPGHRDTWYFAAGEWRGNSASGPEGVAYFEGSGVYKSIDNGETWSLLPATAPAAPDFVDTRFDYVARVAVSPTTGTLFLASNGFGVLRSDDGGASFSLVLGADYQPYWSDVAVASDGTVVATISKSGFTTVSAAGVWVSDMDGQAGSWTDRTPAGFPSFHRRSVLGLVPTDPDLVYVFTETGSGFTLFRLTPSTGAAVDLTSKVSDFGDPVGTLSTQGDYDMVVAVKPDDPNLVLLGGTNIYRSFDAFATKDANSGRAWAGGYGSANDVSLFAGHHPDQHVIVFDPAEPKRVWSGHDGGISLGADATRVPMRWQDADAGYAVTQCYSIAIPRGAGDGRIMCGSQDNGTPFRVWTDPGFGSTKDVSSADGAFAYFGQTFAFVSQQFGTLMRLRYDAQGVPRRDGSTAFVYPDAFVWFVHPYAVDPANEEIVYFPDDDHLWRNGAVSSIPDGANGSNKAGWTELSNVSAKFGDPITAVAASTTPAHDVYFASYGGNGAPRVFVFRNADAATDGEVDVSDNRWAAGAWVSDIAINPADSAEALVVMSNYSIVGAWHTEDRGASWTPVEGNLTGTGANPGPSIHSAAILPTAPGGKQYLLGTSTGVYMTTALAGDATAWTLEGGDSVGNTVVWLVRARTSDNLVAVGTHGRGMFVRESNALASAQAALDALIVEDAGTMANVLDLLFGAAGLN